MRQQLAESLGLPVEDAGLGALLSTQSGGRKVFDDYLWQEQSSLVEGMVRAYARRRLRPLLEEFEVLEVEREGEWELATGDYGAGAGYLKYGENWAGELSDPYSIAFMSRPDALLRSRVDNSLYLMSFKTAATWDRRKELDAQHDMQGLSEGVEVERRLGEWWIQINDTPDDTALTECCKKLDIEYCTGRYLKSIPAPPRILGIRYEYMLKGYRGKDKELSAKLGFDCWSQRSHLVRKYVAHSTPVKGSAFSLGDECWSYDYLKEDGGTTNLYYGHWKSEPVDDVKVWIDKLDQSEEVMSAYDSTVGQDPRSLGWKSAGQTLGFTVQHPLNAIFIPPITVYRSDDQLRDWLEQVEAQEVKVAESVVLVAAATDEDERRSLLNILFPQSRRACEYPSTCGFCAKGQDVCFGGEDIRARPLESGKFVRRVPNHPQELV
jgi:hypothetical protein